MSCFQVFRQGPPERKAIIIILIRTCLAFFAKKGVDAILKVSDVERVINPRHEPSEATLCYVVVNHSIMTLFV